MNILQLPYDRTILEAVIPESVNYRTLRPRPMKPLDDPHQAFLTALKSPADGPCITDFADNITGRVLVIVPDHTRICGKEKTLPWLLDALNEYGIPDNRIRILIALGSHKKPPDNKFKSSVGPAIDRVDVVQHDPSGPMIDCGTTSFGTPVRVNALLDDAELVILLTSAVHHYFAGYGGGRKIIVPGISSPETIQANHSLVFWKMGAGDGRHPEVRSGILKGNPVHDDMLESAGLALRDRKHFSIVTVMTPDKEFGLFSSGELGASHKRACEFIDAHNVVRIDRQADVVFASAGGYPKDINVVQSHKGMDNAVRALKPGGTLLYTMAGSDGFGHPAIEEFARYSLDEIRARLMENYIVYGQTIYAIKEKSQKFRIVLITGLDPNWTRSVGIEPASDLEQAMSMIQDEIKSSDLIYHIPRADLTVPDCDTP